jgi:hypothetical protein
MSALRSLLFPAYSLTGPLVLASCASGLIVASCMQCVTRLPNVRIGGRCVKAWAYGGTCGVAACLFILMAFDETSRPKLTPMELANMAILGFVTAGFVAMVMVSAFSWLGAYWTGGLVRPVKGERDAQSRQFPESSWTERTRAPMISTHRRFRG